MSPAAAREIIDEAESTPVCRKADSLAAWLGLTYADRQKLHIRTIGSVNVKRRARTELRKRSKRLAEETRRRTRGDPSRSSFRPVSTERKLPPAPLRCLSPPYYRDQDRRVRWAPMCLDALGRAVLPHTAAALASKGRLIR
jgi:hypothetical protein